MRMLLTRNTVALVSVFFLLGGYSVASTGALAQAQEPAVDESADATPATKVTNSAGLFGGDSSFVSDDEPIDISADELELDQEKQIAIFKGNVDAVQGTLNLKSEELVIYYIQGADESSDEEATAGGGRTNIRQIDATGDVRLATPKEMASGDWAIYDIEKGVITLGGKVSLTQGENILQGAKLIVDVETGNSRLLAAKNGTERVRGLFVPGSDEGDESVNEPPTGSDNNPGLGRKTDG